MRHAQNVANSTLIPFSPQVMEMTHVLRFLQLLCENHNLQLQNYLRKQVLFLALKVSNFLKLLICREAL